MECINKYLCCLNISNLFDVTAWYYPFEYKCFFVSSNASVLLQLPSDAPRVNLGSVRGCAPGIAYEEGRGKSVRTRLQAAWCLTFYPTFYINLLQLFFNLLTS